KPGELVVVSPDHYDAPRALATRRLYSVHHTLDETVIERLARTRWHDRFATVDAPRAKPTPLAMDETLPAWAMPSARPAKQGTATAPPRDRTAPTSGPTSDDVSGRVAAALAGKVAMTTDEVARKLGITGAKARAALKALVAAGE